MEIRVHLIPDDFHLTHVGELHDGNYFWIDNQLASDGNDTRDFIAVYIFDRKGNLIDSKIIDRGLRSNSDQLLLKEVIDLFGPFHFQSRHLALYLDLWCEIDKRVSLTATKQLMCCLGIL